MGYYHILPPNERPGNWEEFAEEDEAKWQEEQKHKSSKKLTLEDKKYSHSGMLSISSPSSNKISSATPSATSSPTASSVTNRDDETDDDVNDDIDNDDDDK